MTRLAGNYPSRSRNGKIELKILNQPEEQHRARYLTEGSRGSIKDGTGLGHPVVKLFGFNGCPVKLQCFIGHDKHIGVPHLFYQASRITGKNSTRCSTTKIEGTAVITLDLTPENNMQTTIDCIGILKERNVDVEQKVLRLKSLNGSYNNGEAVNFPSKKRCAKCRLVFRCKLPGSNEILQAVSTPILCTQPVGTPEICKISLTECKASGGKELYIIGKNFLKESKVIFKNDDWCKIIEPDKEYLHSSHLICMIPPYDGPNHELPGYFTVSISIRSGGKYSDSHSFTYINDSKANSVLIQRSLPANNNNHHHHGSYPDMIQKQVFLSHLGHGTCDNIKREDSQICRMANSKSMLNQSIPMDTGRYYSEDTLLSSDSSTISETILASEDSCFSNQSTITSPHSSGNNVEMTDFMGRINGSSPLINGSNEGTYDDQRSSLSYNNEPNGVIVSQLRNSLVPQDTRFLESDNSALMKIGNKAENQLFGVSSLPIIPGPNCPSALAAAAAVTQAGPTSCTPPSPLSNPSNNLPPNCMDMEKNNLTASQLMPPPPAPCSILSKEEQQLTTAPATLDTSQLVAQPPSEPSGSVLDARPNSDHHPVSPSHSVNGTLPPAPAAPTPVTNITSPNNVGNVATRPQQPTVPGAGPTIIQASQISAMSQMSDSELIRLINPSTFDEFKEDVSSMFNFGFSSSHLFRK